MKIQSERLTLRGVYPRLKHALYVRCQVKGTSMEKTIIEILKKELEPELQKLENLMEFYEQTLRK